MKISIIGGAGRVGSHIAFKLADEQLCEKLLLVDIVDSVFGEALDIEQSQNLKDSAEGKKVSVIASKNSEDAIGSDVVIVVAGLPLSKAGTLDRSQLCSENAKILSELLQKIKSEKTIYIIISNPVDVMTWLAAKIIGDKKRVFGVSTLTDTARLNTISDGYLIGEHAGIMIPVGTDISQEKAKELGDQVIKSKGGTWFLISSIIAKVARAIVKDEKKQMPLSVLLEGEYGLKDVCLSVPVVLGKGGIEKIMEIDLNPEEKSKLIAAAESVRKGIDTAKKFLK